MKDDIQCPDCQGRGYVDVVSPKNPQKDICIKCSGYGLLDWVSQITGHRTLNSYDEIHFILRKFQKLAKEKKIVVLVAKQEALNVKIKK